MKFEITCGINSSARPFSIRSKIGLEDPLLLPRKGRELDRLFVDPFQPEFTRASAWTGPVPRMRAIARRVYQQSALYGIVRRVWKT